MASDISKRVVSDDLLHVGNRFEIVWYRLGKMTGADTRTKRVGHESCSVASYLLWLARDRYVTPMQLLKLVYICHGWMLGLHGRPLVSEPIQAWKYGPVIPDLYHAYKRYGGNNIAERPSGEPSGFDEDEKTVMSEVLERYGDFTGVQLSALTHKAGTPWDITWKSKASLISNDLIEEHYRELASAT